MSEIADLRKTFEGIKTLRVNIRKIFENLNSLKQRLNSIYVNYAAQSAKSALHFGLDAFHFQKTLIDFEYSNMEKMFQLIDNKMYCEYYKLFKLVVKYAKATINDKKVESICEQKSKYPIYKDLEPYKVYEYELINNLHTDTLQLLEEMLSYLRIKEAEIEENEYKSNNGINIDNYVNTLAYDNAVLNQNIKLYIKYLMVFHKYHTKYLTRFSLKLNILWSQITDDIKLLGPSHIVEPNVVNAKIKSEANTITRSDREQLNTLIRQNTLPSIKSELESVISNLSDGDSIEEERYSPVNNSHQEINKLEKIPDENNEIIENNEVIENTREIYVNVNNIANNKLVDNNQLIDNNSEVEINIKEKIEETISSLEEGKINFKKLLNQFENGSNNTSL